MPQTNMTSKERVLTSLAWREPDRAPIQYYATPEIEQLLREHFRVAESPDPAEEVRLRLGVDLRKIQPVYRGPIKPPADGYTFDIFGVGYQRVDNGRGGFYDEARLLPLAELKTLHDVETYPWPRVEDYDFSGIEADCRRFENFAVCTMGAGCPDIVNGVSRGRGMEQVILDIALRDEVGLAIIDKRCDFHYDLSRRILQAARGRIDILCLGEDMGTQKGRLFGQRDFDEIFRPRLQRFIDLAHEFNAKAMMHSCGDTHEIMPTLIEMGLDVLDAMQPEPPGMDPETIRAICKGKMAFCGLISTQATLPFGTEAQCRADARHRLDVIAPGGGYIFGPAHCIQAGTPLENILATYEEALGHSLR